MAATKQDWGTYYKNALSVDVFLTNLYHHRAFIERLRAFEPTSTLEAGCGTAGMSVFLAQTGIQATACDVDPVVLQVARDNARQWHAPVQVVERDLFRLSDSPDRYDVVFSQGVLEHFDDDRIRRATEAALEVAPAFAFSVPSRYYGHKDFGDERLMTADQWREILAPCGTVEVDYYLNERRKRTLLLRKPLMIMAVVTRP